MEMLPRILLLIVKTERHHITSVSLTSKALRTFNFIIVVAQSCYIKQFMFLP